jgi:heat shock protein HtpX
MLKRICLFLALNLLIVTCVSVIINFLGLKPYLSSNGLDIRMLAGFCLVWGMAGSLISLLLSKKIATWMLSVKIINTEQNPSQTEKKLVEIVTKIAKKANIYNIPEIGIFKSCQPNAFATGASKNFALIAVSSTLLQTLSDDEIEAVVAHEMAHILNGDMVTMSLLQGVINAFVMFLSRIFAYALANANSRDGKKQESLSSFYLFTFIFEMIFLSLGSILLFFVSRKREYQADKGGALLVGKDKMIKALKALDQSFSLSKEEIKAQKEFAAMMIKQSKPSPFSKIFSTHPTIQQRIKYLENLNY